MGSYILAVMNTTSNILITLVTAMCSMGLYRGHCCRCCGPNFCISVRAVPL